MGKLTDRWLAAALIVLLLVGVAGTPGAVLATSPEDDERLREQWGQEALLDDDEPADEGPGWLADGWRSAVMGTPWVLEYSPEGVLHAGTVTGVYRFADGEWRFLDGSASIGTVRALAWSPDGKLTAAANGVWLHEEAGWSLVGGAHSPLASTEVFGAIWMEDGEGEPVLVASHNGRTQDGGGVWRYRSGEWEKLPGTGNPVSVTALGVSPSGVLTAGTQSSGVLHYTGGRWTRLGSGISLIDSQVTSMVWTPDGSLVVSTTRNGVCRFSYAGGVWTRLDQGDLFADTWVNALSAAADGTLLAGVLYRGIWEYAGGVWRELTGQPPALARQSVTALVRSTRGAAAGTYDGALWQLAGEEWQQLGHPGPPLSELQHPRQAAVSPAGVLTLGASGVWQLAEDRWVQVGGAHSAISDRTVTSLGYSPSGALFAGTDRGVWQYAGEVWLRLGLSQDAAAQARVSMLSWSPDGILTAVTAGPGLCRWLEADWSCSALPGDRTPGFEPVWQSWSPEGQLVIGTSEQGVWEHNGVQWRQLGGTISPLRGQKLRFADWSPEGMLTAAAGGGVWVLNGDVWQSLNLPSAQAQVTALAWTLEGELVAATMWNGAWRYTGEEWLPAGEAGFPAGGLWTNDLARTPGGSILYATDSGIWLNEEESWRQAALHHHQVQYLAAIGDRYLAAMAPGAFWHYELPAGQEEHGGSVGGGPTEPLPVELTDIGGHWAQGTVEWGIRRGLVNGYGDGTFRPDSPVSEPEFLAMLMRAHPELPIPLRAPDAHWAEPYYTAAGLFGWPLAGAEDKHLFTRGRAAGLIAASQGEDLSVGASVRYLLERGLARGKTSNTVEGYEPESALTRAEALQLIRNLLDQGATLQPIQASGGEFTVGGIAVGDKEEKVIGLLGEPDRKDEAAYGFIWYIYNQDYSRYVQVGIEDGRVVGLLSNSAEWRSREGIRRGASRAEVETAYGDPLTYILKGNVEYRISADKGQLSVYRVDGEFVTLFYDILEGDTVSGIQAIDIHTEMSMKGYYGEQGKSLESGYERQLFDLANAARAVQGLAPVAWEERSSDTARSHSRDMAEREFFSHRNPDGAGPLDRLERSSVAYVSAAENIAAGQTGPLHVHTDWMNSAEHRVNLLGDYTHLGVGVYFGGPFKVYYTQNFITAPE